MINFYTCCNKIYNNFIPLFILSNLYHNENCYVEVGTDDVSGPSAVPITAYIQSADFDIGDGDHFAFVWRILPDLTFENSTSTPSGSAAAVAMTLYPLQNSGSGTGNAGSAGVTKGATYNITEEYTGQIYTRVRGRQLIFKIASTQIGTTWQLGAPRLDIRADGRR
jgi:hypothetical protein